jgi:lactoylglutathione lyase
MGGVVLNLLVLKTGQLDRLRDFYACLGIAFTEERHGSGPAHFAGRIGDVVLELYPLPEGVSLPDTTTRLGFAVARLDEVLEALGRLAAFVTSPPRQTEWGRRAVVRDPDGRAVELYQG